MSVSLQSMIDRDKMSSYLSKVLDCHQIYYPSSTESIKILKEFYGNLKTLKKSVIANMSKETLEAIEKMLFLVYNEDVCFADFISFINGITSFMANTDAVSRLDTVIEYYKTGVYVVKEKKLSELYNIKVFTKSKEGKTSYKDIDNLNKEVIRLASKCGISDLTTVSIVSTDFSKEFLNIDEILPGMIISPSVSFYSALLNYSSDIISRKDTEQIERYKTIDMFNYINNGVTTSTITSKISGILSTWGTYSSNFEKFLNYLSIGTINY